MDPGWLSNAYLVYDEPGGTAVFVDSGAPLEPLLETVERARLRVTHLLTTHAHHDHVAGRRRQGQGLGSVPRRARRDRRRLAGRAMKLGAVFPQTEIGADPARVSAFAAGVAELGFDHLLAYDHVLGADRERHQHLVGPYRAEHM